MASLLNDFHMHGMIEEEEEFDDVTFDFEPQK